MNDFGESSFPPLLADEEMLSTTKATAELLTKRYVLSSTLDAPTNHNEADSLFTVKQLRKTLLNLVPNKSSGLSGIAPIVLK